MVIYGALMEQGLFPRFTLYARKFVLVKANNHLSLSTISFVTFLRLFYRFFRSFWPIFMTVYSLHAVSMLISPFLSTFVVCCVILYYR
jgi:hypothetical protein